MMKKGNGKKEKNQKEKNQKEKGGRAIAICLVLCCLTFFRGCGSGKDVILIGEPGESSESDPAEIPEGRVSEGPSLPPGGPVQEAGTGESEESVILVYVCGAVKNPGVVSVPAGSRVEEALLAAGGFREDAGREAVNLADWVRDGQMLYFPTKEEAAELADRERESESGGPQAVNINTADMAALCTLPGIGESRAADIIAYREKNGGFQSCEDIMLVPGIKAGAYEKIRDKITVK